MSNENERKRISVNFDTGVIRLSPDLTQALTELNRQLSASMQPILQFAAHTAKLMEPFQGALAQFAEAMRPILESGWLEALQRGTQQIHEAMRNAEAMGHAGWTFPMNAGWSECVLLLREATTPASADAAFIDYYLKDDRQSLVLLLADLQQQPSLGDFHDLLEEIAFGLDHGKHRLVVTALIPMLEGSARRCWEDGVWQGKDRAAFFERKLASLEEGSFDHIIWTATQAFVGNLYSKNKEGDPKPTKLNRHWILHGRGPADGSLADCLRLLQAIHTIVTLAEDERREQPKPSGSQGAEEGR
ncbi:hypothetical protein [Archangium sp.]|uniref:hypothetical protein n=1 Tax=Archangium sp. TaxID=1872627 RepID=UPI002D6A34DF|nr:hypothetical protein [Archangium sp.]HYO58527.1 hypothetical protein [Archangium sp.]